MLSGAIEHLSGDSTDPYLENDLSTSTEATGVARYALADAVSFGSRFSTERQKEVTSSGTVVTPVLQYRCMPATGLQHKTEMR